MENNTQSKEVTPKNKTITQINAQQNSDSQLTPKSHLTDIPISNIKQVTVIQEHYPPSTQLISERHAEDNKSDKPPLIKKTASQSATPKEKQLQRQNSEMNQLVDKITQLESKIKYYETEHNNHQNQLIGLRQQYEEENKKLQLQLDEFQSDKKDHQHENVDNQEKDTLEYKRKKIGEEVKLALEYSEDLITNSHHTVLKEQLAQLQQQNHAYEQQLTTLQSELTQIKDQQLQNPPIQPVSEKVKKPKNELEMVIVREMSGFEIINTSINYHKETETTQQIQKLQKKMNELEEYIQEKDKALMDQETQLTDLNDQNHELLKSEDSLKTQQREKQAQIDDLLKQQVFKDQSWELKMEDMQHQLNAKNGSLQDAFNLVSEKEIEIQRYTRQLRESEEAIKEYRGRNVTLEEQSQEYQQRFQEMHEESEQLKQDFQAILNFKNELEILVEEQTQNIEQKNKRIFMLEDTLRYKESDLEQKESLLRRMTQGADETKKRLTQADMKLRQITQTTMKDLKVKLKDKLNEIEVLKEMVRSANKQAKAKDIDIQRLNQRLKRLEKMNELGKGIIQDGGLQMDNNQNNVILEDENELDDELSLQTPNTFITPNKLQNQIPQYPRKTPSNDILGLNPINYTNLNANGTHNRSVEDEVQMELLAAQQQRQYNNLKNNNQGYGQGSGNNGISQSHLIQKAGLNYRNSKQKEIEEAVELDRMLEQERRNQSQDVFAKKYEQKLDNYYNNLANSHQSNMKNHSSGVSHIFGNAARNDADDTQRNNDSLRYYEGMLPNLNVTKKEQLERELMAEINETQSRKDKYMTPNLQGKSKIINKLNHAAYGGSANQNNSFQQRNQNTSKNRIQL